MGKKSTLSRMIAMMPQAIAELESDGKEMEAGFVRANKLLFEAYFLHTLATPKTKRQQAA